MSISEIKKLTQASHRRYLWSQLQQASPQAQSQHNQMERFLPPTSPLKRFFFLKHLLSFYRQGKETLSFSPPNQPSSDFNKHGKNGSVRSRNQWRISQVLKTATEQEHMCGQRNSSKTCTELNLLMCSKNCRNIIILGHGDARARSFPKTLFVGVKHNDLNNPNIHPQEDCLMHQSLSIRWAALGHSQQQHGSV